MPFPLIPERCTSPIPTLVGVVVPGVEAARYLLLPRADQGRWAGSGAAGHAGLRAGEGDSLEGGKMRRRSAGFTLVEMLVVLGIIVLLVGVLSAAFAPAREKARQAACASNLHQIHQSLMMYA